MNTTNGDLTLAIPLASLPPGRAGMLADVKLFYNSSVWDLGLRYRWTDTGTQQGYELESTYRTSDLGGWHYGFDYGLISEVRPTAGEPQPCDAIETKYIYRSFFFMPDGSLKTLRLRSPDPARYGETPSSDGYYNISMAGTVGGCNEPSYTGTLDYYTTDGSYLRVRVDTTTGNWTAYLPDGMKVEGSSQASPIGLAGYPYGVHSTVNRIYDRNGNSIRMDYVCPVNEMCKYVLTDDLNRTVQVRFDLSEDTVNWQGFGTARQTTVQYGVESLGTVRYRCTATGTECETPLSVVVAQSVTLPTANAGQSQPLTYSFDYSCGNCETRWGELHKVTLPSLATVEYRYRWNAAASTARDCGDLANPVTSKVLKYLERRDGADSLITEQTLYDVTDGLTTVTHPNNGQTRYFFFRPYLPVAERGLVYKVVEPDGSVVDRLWYQNSPYGARLDQPSNPYVALEVRSAPDSAGNPAKAAAKSFSYDKNGNLLATSEYDWITLASNQLPRTAVGADTEGRITGLPAGVTLRRITQNSYYLWTATAGVGNETVSDTTSAYWNPSAPRYLQAKAQTTMSGPGGVELASEYGYDSATTTGNRTSERRWDSTKGSYSSPLNSGNSIGLAWAYDVYGNPTLGTDARSIQRNVVYDSESLYPQTQYEAYQRSEQRTTTFSYDRGTGLLTGKTDVDNQVTTTFDYDWIGRPTAVREAAGLSEERWSRTEYDDAARRVVRRRAQVSADDQRLVTVEHYDPLGRLRLSRELEDAGSQSATSETDGIKVQRLYRYGTNGKSYELVSNPYRAGYSSGAGSEETMGWKLTTRDAGGRIERVESFAGASAPAPWGTNTASTGAVRTVYNGSQATVTDEADRARTSDRDALGRLVSVTEAGSSTTSYTYNALDNLRTVNQGGQLRSFEYSSLSRLRSATNPETRKWNAQAGRSEAAAFSYQYDDGGNLTQKTDAAGVITTIGSYDGLNRPAAKSYGDGSTPGVSYSYDTVRKGAPGAVCSGSTTITYNAYDKLGRVTRMTQTTDAVGYPFTYSYNLADAVTSIGYPSGREVSYALDGLNRVTSVTGTKDAVATVYAGGSEPADRITYAAHGAMNRMKLHNGLTEAAGYNSRMQTGTIGVGMLLSLTLGYGTANNGNVQTQTIATPQATFSQSYTYDGLNRVQLAQEADRNAGQGLTGWSEQNGYDQWGNRWVAARAGLPALTADVPQAGTAIATDPVTGIATNRLGTVTYDGSTSGSGNGNRSGNGNVTGIGVQTFAYDAENRVRESAWGGGTTTYGYDGLGRRVKMEGPAGATVYVYDAGGQLAADYFAPAAGQQPPASACRTCYLTVDQLGSTRMVTDENGGVVARMDYTPYGELIPGDRNGRDAVTGYGVDAGVRQKFTGKERDSETGLDFFGARYFSGAQGRFTSPDPDPVYFQKEMLSDPQRFNLYTYVRNNPLRYVDPKGEAIELTGTDEERAQKLAALKSKIGEAGKYLYDNLYKGKHYVGIYKNGQDGKGPAFEAMNEATKTLSLIIKNNIVSKIEFAQEGAQVRSGSGRLLATVGSIDIAAGKGPGTTRMQPDGTIVSYVLAPGRHIGQLPGPVMSNGQPGQVDTGLVIWHEMGHVLGTMFGAIGPETNERADDLENTIRRLKDPNAPVRMMHDPPPGVRG